MSNDVLGPVVRKLIELPLNMLGVLYDLLEKLSGPHGEEWFEKLKKFLRGELVIKPHFFPAWKTIKLGTHKSANALYGFLTSAGFRISHWANITMGRRAFTLASEEISLELVTATVRELGFTWGTCYDAICTRICELGYDLCPAEVGPQLRLQYKGQPLNERLVIAMEAISSSDGDLYVFLVKRLGDGKWLDTYPGNPGHLFDPAVRIVFVRRKSSTNAFA